MKRILFLLVLIFIASQHSSFAGGPLSIKGGMGLSYGTRPFLYRYDKGPIGTLSNSEATAIFESLFSSWENVTTASIKFQQDTPKSLDFDVTGSNFDPILNNPSLLGYTPIVFDDDGSVLDALYGTGASNNILGLAGPLIPDSGQFANEIPESQAIFNGKFINGIDTQSDPEKTLDSFKGTVIHEIGHGIGLDHSQINVNAIKPGSTQTLRDAVPLEFPVAVNDLFEIRRDDVSSVSFLYPNQSELSKFGKIKGKVFRQDGVTPVLGANVIARNINNPTLEAISCVSDFLETSTGEYILFAVPPGQYKLEIEPIDLSFVEGSGVGPYTKTKSDKSFQNPVPEGFYTGPDLPITTDSNDALIIDVQAGQTINDANIIASTTFIPGSSTSSGGSSNISEEEPNNSVSEAQLIPSNVTISGNASTSDEGRITLVTESGIELILSDIFKFTVTQSSSLNALLVIESDLVEDDLDLVLLDENGENPLDKSSQSGNVDELISRTIEPGTYLLGIGAFSGSASYKLSVTITSNTGGVPVLSLSGPEKIVLRPTGMNVAKIKATGFNFPSSSMCTVSSSSAITTIKPKVFTLSPGGSKNKKIFRIKIPLLQALSLIETDSSETATITVTCSNGASDVIDLLITPGIESIFENRINQKDSE